MAKKSKPRYNPNLSAKENAEKMGVAVSTIYHYLNEKNINPKKEKLDALIAEIKEAIEANPDASQKAIAQLTHHGVATINKYWKIAKGLESLEETPKSFVWKEKAANENGHEMFSDLLKEANEVIEIADQMNVSAFHDFLFGKPETPMFFVGNGGMNNRYPAMLYSMNKGVGLCCTPYMLASLSDETIKNSRFLIMSAGGRNQDADFAAQKLLKLNPDNTAFFTYTTNEKNKVYKRFTDKSKVFVFSRQEKHAKGFISSQSKIFAYALFYRAFTGKSLKDFHIDLTPEKCYKYQLNNSNEKITPPNKINHFLVLYGSYSEPVARDFESVLVETGMASAQLADFRNYCHGRFIFASNHTRHKTKGHRLDESDAAMVLLITPRERQIVEYLRKYAVPPKMPILIIETEYDSPLATIDLLVKSNVFLADLGEKGYGINPNSPPNYSSVEKRDPIHKVLFKSEFNQNGEMSLEVEDRPTTIETETPTKQERIYGIIGAVIGDIAGSRHEFTKKFPKKNFKLFASNTTFTDDSVLTIAIADALLHNKSYAEALWIWGKRYPAAGFGHSFKNWLKGDWNVQGSSIGDGAGMRISPVGFIGNRLDSVLKMAKEATIPTHNSEEGIKAAQAIASSVFLARKGKSKLEIKEYIEKQFGYNLNLSEDEIRNMVEGGSYNMEIAENSTPVAIIAFLNGNDYEDVVRTAVSYGGDADTVGCMAGAIAAAYYGVPVELAQEAARCIPHEVLEVINEFDKTKLTNNRLTPNTVRAWSVDTVVVYGGNEEDTDGEGGFSNTHASRHTPRPLKGFPIHTIGTTMDVIKKDVKSLIEKVNNEPQSTFVIENVGLSEKTNIGIEKMAPLFMPLVDKENVYFTEEYWDYFNSLKD